MRALQAALVSGSFVDFKAEGIEDHAVILQRPYRTDEAARHVLAHALGIARERIAPAPAATRFEAEQIPARHGDAVTEAGRRPRWTGTHDDNISSDCAACATPTGGATRWRRGSASAGNGASSSCHAGPGIRWQREELIGVLWGR